MQRQRPYGSDAGVVSEAYETGRPAEVDTKEITTRDEAVGVIMAMLNDLRKHRDDWQNASLEDYLEALAASIEDLDQTYAERGEKLPDQPSWQMVADLLVAATGHE